MRNFVLAACAATAALCASTAVAGTYVDPWTTSATGVSVVFGNSGFGTPGSESIPDETSSTSVYDADTGLFTDTFDFFLPDGIVGFTLSSIGFTPASSLGSIFVTFNGTNIPITLVSNETGGTSFSLTTGAFGVSKGGQQQLVITGTAGSAAVYSGTATFESTTAVVPEPGAWALMIAGFGGAGAMIRRRREQASTPA